tara:strand:+ start:277 stop:648 length:372 start_codon:yes stop_codon:yes gene_type:complete
MAHFAKLDNNNKVIKVHVVHNEAIMKDGVEDEATGVSFLRTLHNIPAAQFVQTSYNGTFRKNYAGVGYTYDRDKDAFVPPQPFASWSLDDDTCTWKAPVDFPEDGKKYYWDEDNTAWVEITEE